MIAIEFYGMPGSGKTYLSSALLSAAELSGKGTVDGFNIDLTNGNKTIRVTRKFVFFITKLPINFFFFLKVFRVIRKLDSYGISLSLRFSFHWIYMYSYLHSMKDRSSIPLSDQGLLQILWGMTYRNDGVVPSFSAPLLRETIFRIPLDNLIVYSVRVELDTLVKRMEGRKRGDSPLDRDLYGELNKCVLTTKAMDQFLLGFVESTKEVQIISFHNDKENVGEWSKDRLKEFPFEVK